MAQSMDAMTSQASVAGYKAALLAAGEFSGFFPMLTTAAGTIRPASVLVLGAGIAGLQAVATAKRLGAVVTAFDVRLASEEEILSLGAKFLDLSKYGAGEVVEALRSGQGEGGLARRLTPEELALQKSATNRALTDFDIVITTAQVPGSTPPQFVGLEGVKNMKPGSVIVDLAASSLGGNVEGSRPEETVIINNVKVIGAPYLASSSPKASSNLLARNLTDTALHFTKAIGDDTVLNLDPSDELVKAMLITADPEPEVPEVIEASIEEHKEPEIEEVQINENNKEEEK
jgi:NAD(P) transhydrogenase subunit alpha